MNEERLCELINKVIEKDTTADEFLELKKTLKDSSEARQKYYQLCQVHVLLSQNFNALSPLIKPTMPGTEEKVTKAKPIIPFLSILTAAAAVVISFIMVQNAEKKYTASIVKVDEKTPSRGKTLATIRTSLGASFVYGGVNGSELKNGSPMALGSYKLKKGIIELEFPNGARTIIEAPCEFSVMSPKVLACTSGKISALIPPAAKKFTIQTPAAKIIDLGTEFSVWVQKNEFIETHVFKGKVRVVIKSETGEKQRKLQAGDALRVLYSTSDTGSITQAVPAGIDLKSDFFIRNLSEAQSAYSQKILSLKPVLYIPMEMSKDGNIIRDWSPYKNDGLASNIKRHSNVIRRGKIGNALLLSGDNHKAYVYVPDYPKAADDQITVIAWVRAKSRPMWATIVKNWGAFTPGQFHFGLNQNGYLDIEIMSKAQENIQVTEDKKFPLGKWQHVAFVHTGTSLKLYRNGSLIDELPANGLYQSSSIRSLGIGTKISDSDKGVDRANPGHWDGLLDEIAIFNEAFSDEKIREIYETQL